MKKWMRKLRVITILVLFLTGWLSSGFSAMAQAGNLVVFPSPQVEFIVGPQLNIGTSDAKGAQWFDQNAVTRGLSLCAEFPYNDMASSTLGPGTITLTQGSAIIQGTGTRFLTDFPSNTFYPIAFNGKFRQPLYITGAGAQSDTQVTMNVPWAFPTVTEGYSLGNASINLSEGPNYYDFGLAAYGLYYRTGDPRFLDCARKVTDSWWASLPIDNGRSTDYGAYAPRQVSLSGLMLRALDGRPEIWPWVVDYTRNQFDIWVGSRISNASLWFGVREGGYLLLYATQIAATHPDTAIRAEFREKALNAAVNYYARLQQADGSWRWIDDTTSGFKDGEQPFQIGILNEGMIAVHRLTGNEVVKNAILKSVNHEFQKSYNPNGWRGLYYLIYGAWNSGVSCATGCGAVANPWPAANPSDVSDARQLNATTIHQYGYAFVLTGDLKYKQWGDEIFDATYSGTDGFRGYASSRAKEYNESYRSGGKYLAWRSEPTTTPLPSPTPTPSLPPKPIPTPTSFEWKRFDFMMSQSQRDALMLSIGAQGYSYCMPADKNWSAIYCARVKQ